MRLLLVEDDATERKLFTALLERCGHEVIAAASGDQAWEVLQSPEPPRLVVMDWGIPDPDGVEICRRLRAQRARPYVVLLTARATRHDIVSGLLAGADDYVTKPFDPEELEARIQVGCRMVELQDDLARRVAELQEALAHIKTLHGILSICMHCHRIRNEQENWERIESYIAHHSDARFSHAICPDCLTTHYADMEDAPPEAADTEPRRHPQG